MYIYFRIGYKHGPHMPETTKNRRSHHVFAAPGPHRGGWRDICSRGTRATPGFGASTFTHTSATRSLHLLSVPQGPRKKEIKFVQTRGRRVSADQGRGVLRGLAVDCKAGARLRARESGRQQGDNIELRLRELDRETEDLRTAGESTAMQAGGRDLNQETLRPACPQRLLHR